MSRRDQTGQANVLPDLLRATTPKEVFELVTDTLRDELGADVAGVAIDTTEGLQFVTSTEQAGMDGWRGGSDHLYTYLSGVCHSNQSVVVDDVSFTRSAATAAPSAGDHRVRSLVAIPWRSDGSAFSRGVIFAGASGVDKFTQDDQRVVRDLQELATATIERFEVMDADLLGQHSSSEQGLVDPALDAGGAVLFVANRDSGAIQAIWGSVEELTGVPASELYNLGDVLDRLVHEDNREAAARLFDETQTGDRDWFELDHRLEGDAGSARWLRLAVERVDHEGERLVAGHATEISTAKARERELKKRLDRFEDVIGIVSHDLKNLINLAISRIELVRAEADNEDLASARRTLERIDSLVENTVVLAPRRDDGVSPIRIDLGDVSRESWKTVETADASLVVASERTIRADRNQLQLVLENLFRNAVAHGGEAVSVTVDDTDDGFAVADDGPGIPPDHRERVFESGFSQGGSGQGLGLSIVEKVCDAHGWTIEATASTEGGARFVITGVDIIE